MADKKFLTRIRTEIKLLTDEPCTGITVTPKEDDLRYFNVLLAGPVQTPYEGGIFKLEVFLDEGYPYKPPKIRFITRIYHPNIDKLGRICLDVLKDKWGPTIYIRTLLLTIQGLMSNPNPDDPLANDVANHWKTDEVDAIKTAQKWTETYAREGAIQVKTKPDDDDYDDNEELNKPQNRPSMDDNYDNYDHSEEGIDEDNQ